MKKFTMFFLVAVLSVAVTGSANAISWTTNVAHIYAAGGLDVAVPGLDGSLISSLADPFGGSIGFSNPVEIRTGNISWIPWRSGSNAPVLWTGLGNSSVTLNFDNSCTAFGMYAMPNLLSPSFDVTLGLEDGSELTQTIYGGDGPAFFGFRNGVGVDWMTISVDEPTYGLGFGEMVMAGGSAPAVPEPATLLLFGLGLVGAGVVRKFKR